MEASLPRVATFSIPAEEFASRRLSGLAGKPVVDREAGRLGSSAMAPYGQSGQHSPGAEPL